MTSMPSLIESIALSLEWRLPLNHISPPLSGETTPERTLISVDFPLPFSPTRQ